MGAARLDPKRVIDLAFPPSECDNSKGEEWVERQLLEIARNERYRSILMAQTR